jgi:hypothetical protein
MGAEVYRTALPLDESAAFAQMNAEYVSRQTAAAPPAAPDCDAGAAAGR